MATVYANNETGLLVEVSTQDGAHAAPPGDVAFALTQALDSLIAHHLPMTPRPNLVWPDGEVPY